MHFNSARLAIKKRSHARARDGSSDEEDFDPEEVFIPRFESKPHAKTNAYAKQVSLLIHGHTRIRAYVTRSYCISRLTVRLYDQLGYDLWTFKGEESDAGTTYVRDIYLLYSTAPSGFGVVLTLRFVLSAHTSSFVAQVSETDDEDDDDDYGVEETCEQHGKRVRRGRSALGSYDVRRGLRGGTGP
jgi:hypothetical protein